MDLTDTQRGVVEDMRGGQYLNAREVGKFRSARLFDSVGFVCRVRWATFLVLLREGAVRLARPHDNNRLWDRYELSVEAGGKKPECPRCGQSIEGARA